jgi:hypothetical protein
MNSLSTIQEQAHHTPVWHECDVCVIGGSGTGVFAAVRAARLGLRVALVERMGCFGGVATLSLVNVWHSPYDEIFKKQIFAGLTLEVIERLRRRNAVTDHHANPSCAWSFNPQELQIELDELVAESRIRPWLHTVFAAPHVQDGRLCGVIVENKSGRGAILASQFIDASGDGDVAHRLGLATYISATNQPSTTCAIVSGWESLGELDLGKLQREHGKEFGLPLGTLWSADIPGSTNRMLAATRIYDANCSDGDALTRAEIEGRRQVRAIFDLVRKYVPKSGLTLQALPARLGIRETRHVRGAYQLTGNDVLYGRRFDDAIANGSYRVDIHHNDKPGITLRYLNGLQQYTCPGRPVECTRWREETPTNPTFYQIPLRSMLPQGASNLIMAGRMIDTDPVAHAAVRVMVNMNQTGEAAGVTAALAVQSNRDMNQVDASAVRAELARGGSIIL